MKLLFSRIIFRVFDITHFIRKLTLPKLINFSKVFISYYISRMGKNPSMIGYPVSISLEPTTSCNLRCPECVSGLRSFTRPTGMLSPDFYRKIIDELHKVLINLTLYFQGEPFLNPDFYDMITYARKNGIYTFTSTNGHYLSEENSKKLIDSGLDRIIISVDNFNQKAYEKYRIGGNINTVISGISNLVRMRRQLKKQTPFIILQFLVNRDNENNFKNIRKASYDMGVDQVVFKTMQIYNYQEGSSFIPVNEKYTRYRHTGGNKYILKNRLFNHCWKMWHSCVITWDGRIIPCCFDKNAGHSLGRLNGQGVKDIWKNNQYYEFRKVLFNNRSSVDICRNCSEGTNVWI